MAPIVDLRSDTVTQPTEAMRRAMAAAVVGDDGYGEDPTVAALEERYAQLVGKEAALLVPSGVMANQIAIRVHTRPGDVVLAPKRSHVVLYELGASARNAGVQFGLLDDPDGMVEVEAITAQLKGTDYHQPTATLLSLENTHMPASGAVWDLERLVEVRQAARPLKVHLDGARLFNAAVASGHPASAFAAQADSVMSCLSKGLAAPVGSMLAGDRAFIEEARVERKRLGGAMRQAGIIAAAGLVALETMVERLAEDHRRARRLAEAVADRFPDGGVDPARIATNVIVVQVADDVALSAHLEAHGIRTGAIAPGHLRLVTHCDVDDAGIEQAMAAIAGFER